MLMRTEAVVLRYTFFLETSQFVTIYTLKLGKLTTITHGAQSNKSRLNAPGAFACAGLNLARPSLFRLALPQTSWVEQ